MEFVRRYALATSLIATFVSFLISFSVVGALQNVRAKLNNESLQAQIIALRKEREANLRELTQAVARADSTAVRTTRVQERISATAEGVAARIAEVLEKVRAVDARLQDFEQMIGTDDRVKILMTTTAMAQEIAARKQFQDSVDSKLSKLENSVRLDVEPIRQQLESLQVWLIGSLLSVIFALSGVIWLLVKRAAALYTMVTAASNGKALT